MSLWCLDATGDAQRLDKQIEELVERLQPHVGQIRTLVETSDCIAVLQIVRYFNHPEGQEEQLDNTETEHGVLAKLPGQHQLLGWSLSWNTIDFLAASSAIVDVDEYDSNPTITTDG